MSGILSGMRDLLRKHVLPQAFAAFLVIACSSSEGSADAKPKTHSIAIQGFAYLPATVTVAVGDTVVWINQDVVPHTATAEGKFDSGSIGAKQTGRVVIDRKGRHPYLCTFHPNMKAELIAQ